MKEILTSWKTWVGVLTGTMAIITFAAGGVEKTYDFVHNSDIRDLKEQLVASNEQHQQERELLRIRYDIRDIETRLYYLERRQEAIWERVPMSDQDQKKLRVIEREIRKLESEKKDLLDRQKELR